MSKRIVLILTFFCLALCFIPSAALAETESAKDSDSDLVVYKSATEYDYPPFSVTSSGKADGFSVELLKSVAQETGIQLSFKIDQWAVIKEELRNGQLDVLPLVSYSEERDEYYDFSVPYIVMICPPKTEPVSKLVINWYTDFERMVKLWQGKTTLWSRSS